MRMSLETGEHEKIPRTWVLVLPRICGVTLAKRLALGDDVNAGT